MTQRSLSVALPEDDWLNLLRCHRCHLTSQSQMSLLWLLSSCSVADVCICDCLLFLQQAVGLALLLASLGSIKIGGNFCCPTCHALTSITQPSTQAPSPQHAVQLLQWCIGSGSQPDFKLFFGKLTTYPKGFSKEIKV